MKYKTWIEISRSAIEHNIRELRHVIGPEVKLMAVVKSNAYGHGIFAFSRVAQRHVDWFGVDSLREGVHLCKQGIRKPILVLGYTLPEQYREAETHNITLTFYNREEIPALQRVPKLRVHIKIDTGMHRQGVPLDDLPTLLRSLKHASQIEGLYTHFSSAKERTPKFKKFTEQQINNFEEARAMLEAYTKRKLLAHAAATAGIVHYPQAHFDMVRSGIGLYGAFMGARELDTTFEPVLTWKTMIAQVKRISNDGQVGYDMRGRVRNGSTLLVLPVGYWHGYDRRLSGGLGGTAYVLVRGKRAPVCGIISMDMLVVRSPRGVRPRLGDEVVLVGKQGNNRVGIETLAREAGASQYDLLTGLNPLIYRKVV